MKARILNKAWNVVFVPEDKLDPDNRGECDDPSKPGRQIRLFEDLSGELLLDTLLHESAHAGGWNLAEEYIEQLSSDVAAIIWRPSVLRRILNDPLAKRIVLELLCEDHSKDKSKQTPAATEVSKPD